MKWTHHCYYEQADWGTGSREQTQALRGSSEGIGFLDGVDVGVGENAGWLQNVWPEQPKAGRCPSVGREGCWRCRWEKTVRSCSYRARPEVSGQLFFAPITCVKCPAQHRKNSVSHWYCFLIISTTCHFTLNPTEIRTLEKVRQIPLTPPSFLPRQRAASPPGCAEKAAGSLPRPSQAQEKQPLTTWKLLSVGTSYEREADSA